MDRNPEGIKALAQRILNAIDSDPHPPEDSAEREQASSLRAMAQRLHDMVDVVPWEWVTADWLAGIESAVEPAAEPLETYAQREDRGPAPFPISWALVTSAWGALTPLIPAIPGRAAEDLAREVVAFRTSAESAIDAIRAHVADTKTQLSALDNRLAELDQSRADAVAQIEQKQAEMETIISEQTSRLEAAIRDNQAQFSTAQESNRQSFTTIVEEARAKLVTEIDSMRGFYEESANQLQADGESAAERMKALETEATRSYEAVTTASVAGFFQKEANDQGKAADRWRIVGVLVLIVLGGATIAELLLGDPSPNLDHTAARLPFALAAAALAGYALSESSQHRKEERRLRQREVDVSTIAPYLANIGDESAAEKLRLDHARRLFLGEEPEPDHGPPE